MWYVHTTFFVYIRMIHFHIITLFPETVTPYLGASMMWRAQKEKKVRVSVYNPREFTKNKHRKVDGKPYGGGPGMVMSVQPIVSAVRKAVGRKKGVLILLTSPQGELFNNIRAEKYALQYKHIVIIAGHYEGIDARVKKILRAKEVSIGEYVLTGGELPALVILDAVVRQIPGVLGNSESLENLRDTNGECYTRPEVYVHNKKKYRVPKILLSGRHKEIELWRSKKSTNN